MTSRSNETIYIGKDDTPEDAFHTHDEELRGVDFSRPKAALRAGESTVAMLHMPYEETRDGARVVPATE